MAGTTVFNHTESRLSHKIVEGVFTFDSSYPAGGELITDLSTRIERATRVDFYDTAGYILDFDVETQKVVVKSNLHTYTASVDPASAATDAIADLAVTVTGVVAGDIIIPVPAADVESGVIPVVAIATTDTVTLRLSNPTAGTVNGAAKTWTFHALTATPREIVAATNLSTLAVKFRAYGA